MQKNMPRKKRRKLEAAREMLEDDEHDDKPKVSTPYLLTFYIRLRLYSLFLTFCYTENETHKIAGQGDR